MFDWQDILIWLLVVGAVSYLLVRVVRWRCRQKVCRDCKLRLVASGEEPVDSKPPTVD